MSVEKIANRQFFFILFMMRTTIVIAFLPVVTTADALQDAWLSAVASFAGSALLVCVIGAMAVRFPGETVVGYSQKLLGKWPGRMVSLVFLAAFLFMAATDSRIYVEALITGFLTETPLLFIMAVMVFTAALAASAGIEVIGRVADIFFPLFFLMILLSLAMAAPQAINLLENLEPVLARGAGPVLRGAVTPTAVASQYLVLLIITPSLTEPKRALRTALAALAASSATLVLVALTTTAVLNPERAARTVFPFFSMVRAIHFTEFLERIEVLAIFAWGFGLFIGLSTYLFCGSRGMAQVLGMKSYRPLIWPMAVVWTVLGVHGYRDLFQVRTMIQPAMLTPLTAAGFVLAPMAAIWLGYAVRSLAGRFKPGGA